MGGVFDKINYHVAEEKTSFVENSFHSGTWLITPGGNEEIYSIKNQNGEYESLAYYLEKIYHKKIDRSNSFEKRKQYLDQNFNDNFVFVDELRDLMRRDMKTVHTLRCAPLNKEISHIATPMLSLDHNYKTKISSNYLKNQKNISHYKRKELENRNFPEKKCIEILKANLLYSYDNLEFSFFDKKNNQDIKNFFLLPSLQINLSSHTNLESVSSLFDLNQIWNQNNQKVLIEGDAGKYILFNLLFFNF